MHRAARWSWVLFRKSSGRISGTLFLAVLLTAGCGKEGRKRQPPVEQEQRAEELEKKEPPPPLPQPDPNKISFNDVQVIFNRPAYGPCATCHATEWPYLPASNVQGGWQVFLKSLAVPTAPVKSKDALVTLILACVDPSSEEHCAGDPTTADDNVDYKMPSKFFFDPVTAEDLAVLRRWQAAGAPE